LSWRDQDVFDQIREILRLESFLEALGHQGPGLSLNRLDVGQRPNLRDATWLAEETPLIGLGTETVGTDAELAAFTGDTSNLLSPSSLGQTQSAIDEFVSQGDVDYAQFKQERAIETTMQAFLGIAWSLSGIPGRKTLLWATGGFPFAMDSPSSVPGGYLSELYERAMQAMNEADVSVYPVDAQGLVNYGPSAITRNLPSGAAWPCS